MMQVLVIHDEKVREQLGLAEGHMHAYEKQVFLRSKVQVGGETYRKFKKYEFKPDLNCIDEEASKLQNGLWTGR